MLMHLTMMMTMMMTRTLEKGRVGSLVEKEGTFRSPLASLIASITSSSGLSVQNPDHRSNIPGGDLVRGLLRKAAEYAIKLQVLRRR